MDVKDLEKDTSDGDTINEGEDILKSNATYGG